MEDPVEEIIEDALKVAGVNYTIGRETYALDFHLTDMDTHIECKRMHTPRIADQMSRHENVIAIQGIEAARAFASLIID